jgi:hypothetical protein
MQTIEELVDMTAEHWARDNEVYSREGVRMLKERLREQIVATALSYTIRDRKFVEEMQRASDE